MSLFKSLVLVSFFASISFAPLYAVSDTTPLDGGGVPDITDSIIKEFSAEIKLITPLTIKRTKNMRFPVKIAGWEGTVKSNEEGLFGAGIDASFYVTGERNASYVISGLEPLIITDPIGGGSITVTLTVFAKDGGYNDPKNSDGGSEGVGLGLGVTRILNDRGEDTFNIRGTATLLARHRAGIYSGTREIVASYY